MFFDKSYKSNTSSNGSSPANSGNGNLSPDNSEDNSLTATQLLALAIRKRRRLIDDRERDFRRELMHTSVIQQLCKYLGENRAKARRHQHRPRRPRHRRSMKRRWSEEEDGEGLDQLVPDNGVISIAPKPLDQFGYDSAVQNSDGDDDQHQHWEQQNTGSTTTGNNDGPTYCKRPKVCESDCGNFTLFNMEEDNYVVFDVGHHAHKEQPYGNDMVHHTDL